MGRPKKYSDVGMFPENCFGSERELCDYVETNIGSFSKDILGVDYVTHEKEYRIYRHAGPRAEYGVRTDFYISSKDGPIIVEVKNPSQKRHELSRAVSQLLAQGSAFKRMHGVLPRMILLTSSFVEDVTNIIEDFALPVEVIIMSREYAGVIKIDG